MHVNSLQQVFVYHQATRHRFEAFAGGPGFLDWQTRSDPSRRYAVPETIAPEGGAPAG